MKLLRWWFTPRLPLDVLDDAIAQARKEEREAIIQIMKMAIPSYASKDVFETLNRIAAAIRARGEGK